MKPKVIEPECRASIGGSVLKQHKNLNVLFVLNCAFGKIKTTFDFTCLKKKQSSYYYFFLNNHNCSKYRKRHETSSF